MFGYFVLGAHASEELKYGKLKIESESEPGAKARHWPHHKQAAFIVIVNLTILLPIAK